MDYTVNPSVEGRLKGPPKAVKEVGPTSSPMDSGLKGKIEPEMGICKEKNLDYSQLSTLSSSDSVSTLLLPNLSSILRPLPDRRFNSVVRMLKRSYADRSKLACRSSIGLRKPGGTGGD